jgi:hypothetical protein
MDEDALRLSQWLTKLLSSHNDDFSTEQHNLYTNQTKNATR